MNLKEIRKESGLKVKKIAEVLGISRSHYYQLENGNTKLSDDKIEKLSKLFHVSYQYVKECTLDGGSFQTRTRNLQDSL